MLGASGSNRLWAKVRHFRWSFQYGLRVKWVPHDQTHSRHGPGRPTRCLAHPAHRRWLCCCRSCRRTSRSSQSQIRAGRSHSYDTQLPILDGYEATRQIKTDPILAKTPIVAVSSFAMKGDEEKARAAGCDYYVTKPYSPRQLLRTIRGVLGE